MDVPIRSVEWVGDMSAPSILPHRKAALSPGPGAVIESLMKQIGDVECLLAPKTTTKAEVTELPTGLRSRPTVSCPSNVRQLPPDYIVNGLPKFSRGFLSHSCRTNPWPRTDRSVRSRIATTTPSRPTSSRQLPALTLSSLPDDLPIQDARNWPCTEKGTDVASHRAQCYGGSRALARSSRKIRSSDQGFFTPPCTRNPSTRVNKGKGKAFERANGPGKSGEGPSSHSAADNLCLQPTKNTNDETFEINEQSASDNRKRKLIDASYTSTAGPSSSHEFSSSLYSRPKSRVFRSHSQAMDGADAPIPRVRSPICGIRERFSFDNSLHAAEVLAEKRSVPPGRVNVWTGGKREEISRLRNDNAALKKQISDLRDEFQALKKVLLEAETHRRWQECVL